MIILSVPMVEQTRLWPWNNSQLVIGDLDSIDEKVFKSCKEKTKIVTFPEKDESDLELALLEACKKATRKLLLWVP